MTNPLDGAKVGLYVVLIIMVLAPPIGWAIDHWRAKARYNELQAKAQVFETDAKNAREANSTNQKTITDLRSANQKLADERKAQQEAAKLAATQLAAVREELGQQVAKNAALRQKMGEKDANVRDYLDAGMPCELARQLWGKQAGYCAN